MSCCDERPPSPSRNPTGAAEPWFARVPLPLRRSDAEVQCRAREIVCGAPIDFMVTALRLQDAVHECAVRPSLDWMQDDALYFALEENAAKPHWKRAEARGGSEAGAGSGADAGVTAVLLGVDAQGFTVSCFVGASADTGGSTPQRWRPYFDIEVPKTWTPRQYGELLQQLPHYARPAAYSETALPHFYGFEPDEEDPTRPKRWRCWTLFFDSLSARADCIAWFQKCPECFKARRGHCSATEPLVAGNVAPRHVARVVALPSDVQREPTALRVVNAMQSPESLFLFDAKLKMSGWVRARPHRVRAGLARHTRRTTDDIECDVGVDGLSPLEDVEDIAPLGIAGFDIETQSHPKGFLRGGRAFPSLSSGDCTSYCGVSFTCSRGDVSCASSPSGGSDATTTVMIVRAPCTRTDNTAAALAARGPFALEDWEAVQRDRDAVQQQQQQACESTSASFGAGAGAYAGVESAQRAAKKAAGRVFVHWVDTSKDLVEAYRDLLVWAQPSVVMGWNNYGFDEAFLFEEYMQNFLDPSERCGESAQAAIRAKIAELHMRAGLVDTTPAVRAALDAVRTFAPTAELLLQARKMPHAWREWDVISRGRRDIGPVAAFSVEKAAKLVQRQARAAEVASDKVSGAPSATAAMGAAAKADALGKTSRVGASRLPSTASASLVRPSASSGSADEARAPQVRHLFIAPGAGCKRLYHRQFRCFSFGV